jgi:aminoglycoside phosphotransferase family enzyme/gluconate kinase
VATPQAPLIRALLDPDRYDHPVARVELVETHISWVLLAGEYAYKIKKPVDLGFLDFSTLPKRRHFCEEELRLNRRLAPQIYLGVVPITGTIAVPRIGAAGEPIEYAVKMRRFAQEAQLDRVLGRGELKPQHIDALADELARFHGEIAVAAPGTPFGEPDAVYAPMHENFEQIRPRVDAPLHAPLVRLEQWTQAAHKRLASVLAARKRDGFIRECHGDAHLANMALLDSEVVLFDCLEFNENLRWIDIMSELAFAVMDLDDRGRPDFGWRLLNRYLEQTGDYAGLGLLRFYQVYRALVRAKVAAIRLSQPGLRDEDRARAVDEYQGYMELAERYTQPRATPLLITHGVSGSGKSTVAQMLLESYGAVRVRSDVERKRLAGLHPMARSESGLDSGLYSADLSRQTYARLGELARVVIGSGLPVIVDATFLRRVQRDAMRALATSLEVPFVILDTTAPDDVLRARVRIRRELGHDVSEATAVVLERQLATRELLGAEERAHSVRIETEPVPTAVQVQQLLADHLR